MKIQSAFAAFALLLYASPAFAQETVRATVTIDNPDYGQGALGVQAYTSAPATGVTASHSPQDSPSYGTWNLDPNGSNTNFWNWSPARADYVSGTAPSFDGTLTVSAIIGGVTHIISGVIPADVEIAIPTASWSFDESGNLLAGLYAVEGADFYNLWLWNNTTSAYTWSQSFSPTPISTTIEAGLLTPGNSYNLYFMANNNFSAGDSISGVFRSYTSGSFTVTSVAAVPEPATWAMMLIGFGAMGVSMRRRRRTNTLLQTA